MYVQLVLALFAFVIILLMIRTSYINKRMGDLEDVVNTCVTKDRLRELVVATIRGALEEEDAPGK